MARIFPAFLVALLLSPPFVWAQTKAAPWQVRDWQNAFSRFQRQKNAPKPVERAEAAKVLGAALIPGVHLTAVRHLTRLLETELRRGRSREEAVEVEVVDACVAALRSVSEPRALAWLNKTILDGRKSWRLRFHLIQGLGAETSAGSLGVLCAASRSSDPRIRIAAMDRLAAVESTDAVDALLAGVSDRTWQVQVAALRSLRRLPLKRLNRIDAVVEKLVPALSACSGRIRFEIASALQRMTGKEIGFAPAAWEAWLARRKKGLPEETDPLTVLAVPEYHGIKIWSDRVVFVVDITGSMADPARESRRHRARKAKTGTLPPWTTGRVVTARDRAHRETLVRLKRENDERRVWTKMDAEKKELINAVVHLRPATLFTIVFYAHKPFPWKKRLVRATLENKVDAVQEIERVSPYGGTDIFQALASAFSLTEDRGSGGRPAGVQTTGRRVLENLDLPVDEIFLLTDGCPTVGRIIDTLRIRKEVRKLNMVRRIRINTIAVGIKGRGVSPVDLNFMMRLALDNYGEFVHVD